MENLNLDSILEIVNEEKEKKELENYVPCYPMLRKIDNKLFIAVMLSNLNDDVWKENSNLKPEYWCLIDINTLKIIEFNKTNDKDYIIYDINNHVLEEKNELVNFEHIKQIEYENFLLNDIKNSEIPLQSELFKSLNDEMIINNKKVNINDYIMDNLQDIIKIKAKEIVDILVQSKYSLITICYDNIFNEIVREYKKRGTINIERIKLCIRIMNNYYCGIVGIEELFNL